MRVEEKPEGSLKKKAKCQAMTRELLPAHMSILYIQWSLHVWCIVCTALVAWKERSSTDIGSSPKDHMQALGKWKNHYTNIITQADATAHVANAALQNSVEAKTLSKGLLPVLEVNFDFTFTSRLGHVLAFCLVSSVLDTSEDMIVSSFESDTSRR
eukprot:6483497-Amphidinium_carterae.1